MRFIVVLILALCLTGCSSARFFTSDEIDVKYTASNDTINTADFSERETLNLAKHCESLPNATISHLIIRLICANEVLNRDMLPSYVRVASLQIYNDALFSIVKIATSDPEALENITLSAHLPASIVFAREVRANDERLQPVIHGELGVNIISRRANSQQGSDEFYPLEGVYESKTILLDEIIEKQGDVHLSLKLVGDELTQHTITLGHNEYLIKYSYGAAYLTLLESATIDDYGWRGFLDASSAEARMGVFSIGKISKTKTPIIMIHGLRSNPLIWRYLTMAILNDPELNNEFQVWHVYYPSGPPPFYSAMRVRHKIQRLFDSEGLSSLTQEAVFVGHSMGGVIAKTLSIESGTKLWDATFIEPPEKLLTEESKEVRDIFIFSPIFKHNKVFFLDTPHKGSEAASSAIGYLGSALVSLPSTFLDVFRHFFERVGINKLTESMLPFLGNYGPNSVQVLRPNHPLMEALYDIDVIGESYSIIGSQSVTSCTTQAECNKVSDGVVAYGSSNYPRSKETIMVRSSHNSYQSQNAIDFILSHLKVNR